jgi:hypothetical protein
LLGDVILVIVWGITMLAWQYQIQQFMKEREKWQAERKDLLDRIQAPTFNEYASKVIREKKAEQPEEPQEEIEFIS